MDPNLRLVEHLTRNLGQSNQRLQAPIDVPAADSLLTLYLRYFAGFRGLTLVDGICVPLHRFSLMPVRQMLARPLRALSLALDPTLPFRSTVLPSEAPVRAVVNGETVVIGAER